MYCRAIALIVALSACRSTWNSQYGDRAWHALVAVPAQEINRSVDGWVSIDGTAYPVIGAKIVSPVAQGPLEFEQLGVVEREMWFRATNEAGSLHGIAVPLHIRTASSNDSARVLVEVESDQPCRLGQPAPDIIIHHEDKRITLASDGTYHVGDVRIVVTVRCTRRDSTRSRGIVGS